ncbi:MAG: NAD(P)/FAD-dependent oxidoreductase [Burkholderiaceae bacterium]
MLFDIVIVGGGAGGLELAATLGRKLGRRNGPEKILLIDQAGFHVWKPSLHEVAAGTLDIHQEGLSYPILARRNHFSFTIGELLALDANNHKLTLGGIQDDDGHEIVPVREVSYRWAVLAVGSGSNFFGTPGAAEHSFVLERVADAERFRQRLLASFTRAAFGADKQMTIAIVGGGATGVELSAELLEAHEELMDGYGSEQRFRFDISIVEAGPRILNGLPERLSERATTALENRHVKVLTKTAVQEVKQDGLLTESGEIPADLVVWAAGIKAAESNSRYGLKTNQANQFVVDDRLQTSAPGVYAIGDCAAVVWHDDRLVPARAQAAHQQAEYLLDSLLAQLKNRSIPAKPFEYKDFGSLVSLGEDAGVGSLMGVLAGKNFLVEGLVAKWMYMSLHLNHHRAILGTRGTAVLALARLLQRRVSGRLKLH